MRSKEELFAKVPYEFNIAANFNSQL